MLNREVRLNDNKSSADEFPQAKKKRGESIICDGFEIFSTNASPETGIRITVDKSAQLSII